MKKKKAGIIASSVAAIAVCSSMVVGSTLALFTSEDKVNIAVTSGKVEFTAEVGEIKASSTLPGQDGSYQAAGSASKENGVISIDGMSPGDMFEFTVTTTNTSTISAWYRAKIEIDNEVLAAALTVKIGEATAAGLTAYATEWENLAAKKAPAAINVAIAFPDSVEDQNVFQGKTGNIIVTVEGRQGNTAKPEADELTFSVANGEQLVNAVAKANELSTKTIINIVNDIELKKELYIDAHTADLTINGNNHIITADANFEMHLQGQLNLVKINNTASKVTFNDVTLKHIALVPEKFDGTNSKTYHTLDICGGENVVLNNVTLIRDVEAKNGGAPLVVGRLEENDLHRTSNVTANGLHLVAGGASTWYGANVDAKNIENGAKLTLDKNFTYIDMDGATDIRAAIRPEKDGVVVDAAGRLIEATFVDGNRQEYTAYKVAVATIGDSKFATLNEAINSIHGTEDTALVEINLLQDFGANAPLYFNGDTANSPKTINSDITLNGNNHLVFAARTFEQNAKNSTINNPGRYDLIKFDQIVTNITIKDISLEFVTTLNLDKKADGKYPTSHTLDIYTCTGDVTLENVSLTRDITGTSAGAPLVVKSSYIKATGLDIAVGGNSWYGINVDGTGELTVNGKFTFATTATKYVARCEGQGEIVGLSDKIELDAELGAYGFYVLK